MIQRQKGIEPSSGAWKAPVIAIIRLALGSALLDYYKTASWRSGFFFDGRKRGTCVNKKALELAYNAAVCAALEITDEKRKERGLTFHSWRHWFVTYVKAEAGAASAKRLARHRSASMTERYDDPTADQHMSDARLISTIYDRVEDAVRDSSQAITRDT